MRTAARRIIALAIAIAGVFAMSTFEVLGRVVAEPGATPVAPAHTPPPFAPPETPVPSWPPPASQPSDPASPTPGPASPTPSGTARAAGACGQTGARVFTYRLVVERATGARVADVRAAVREIVCDRRGWTASGRVRFREDPDGRYVISLRTPSSTERRCSRILGRPSGSYFSCASATEAVINSARWRGGSRSWPGSVAAYRHLVVNHEVGHVLGMRHRGCTRRGARAPVMMQQSKGLGGCVANPWPTPAELRALPFGR